MHPIRLRILCDRAPPRRRPGWPSWKGTHVKRLPVVAVLVVFALALAYAMVAPRPTPRRSVAVTHAPVLHFPLLHTLHRQRPARVERPVRSAHGDARPRMKMRRLPAWFVRRRMAAITEQLA